MKRREFLSGSIMTMAGISLAGKVSGAESVEGKKQIPEGIDPAYPTLQSPDATSMGIVWGWRNGSTCSGWVEYTTKSDFSDFKIAYATGPSPFRMISKKNLSVQIRGLKPHTKYYYRTVTCEDPGGKKEKIHKGKNYHFTTLGETADSSFAVINDTHVYMDTFAELVKKIDEINPSVTVWNGDICNYLSYQSYAYSLLLDNYGKFPFATERPFLYVPGNHDYRGNGARILKNVFIPRLAEDHPGYLSDLDRNFAVRVGDIAMIGMDTTEDKPDAHFVGWTAFEPYMALETKWLEKALEKPEIKNAPYLLVFTHIPLFYTQALKDPDVKLRGYPWWHPICSKMWTPLLNKYGVQAVISGHTHAYQAYLPSKPYPWYQIVGGGPSISNATVIDGKVKNGALTITAHSIGKKKVLDTFVLKPRV